MGVLVVWVYGLIGQLEYIACSVNCKCYFLFKSNVAQKSLNFILHSNLGLASISFLVTKLLLHLFTFRYSVEQHGSNSQEVGNCW